MLFYYITDRRQFRGSEEQQRAALLAKVAEAARAGVDYVQLREKDLSARELLRLAEEARAQIAAAAKGEGTPRLLINSRIDVALAAGADGVHLRSDDISAAEARAVWTKAAASRECVIACSCHSAEAVQRAASEGADFAVFAPVFEKSGQRGAGLEALRAACKGSVKANTPEPSPALRIPVLALGGVRLENAPSCIEAGAAGIAGIRLFQDHDIAEVVARLRGT